MHAVLHILQVSLDLRVLLATLKEPRVRLQTELKPPPQLSQCLDEPIGTPKLALPRLLHGPTLTPEPRQQTPRQAHRDFVQALPPRPGLRDLTDVPENADRLLTYFPQTLLVRFQVREHRLKASACRLEGSVLQLLKLRGQQVVALLPTTLPLGLLGIKLLRRIYKVFDRLPQLQRIAVVRLGLQALAAEGERARVVPPAHSVRKRLHKLRVRCWTLLSRYVPLDAA
mmetsp:Transcript_8156/g.24765  ORF Transcript_8156/g.24765 Transcript_8156/m.24765 type:complete len:227 (-) Transcript_8156:51-731(-)